MKNKIVSLACALLCSVNAFGHGSMADPISRVYEVFLENPQSPTSAAGRAAVAVAGTQAFYDWNEVSRNVLDYNYQAVIPDGQLPGAGRAKYAGLNLARTDWPATSVVAGPRLCRFYVTTVHDPSFFKAYITNDQYDPRLPLRWSDLVEVAGANTATLSSAAGTSSDTCTCTGVCTCASLANANYYMTLQLPQRTGRHVLFVIWQRIDPNAEVFFSTSDLDYGGVDYGNPDAPSIIHGVGSFAFTNQWSGGGQGNFKIVNNTSQTMQGWSLEFDWAAQVPNVWNGVLKSHVGNHYVVTNADYNATLAPGASVDVGCTASFSTPGLLPTNIIMYGNSTGGSPCQSDLNSDGTVDSADVGALLLDWGQASSNDFNGDGTIDSADLAVILLSWGPCSN